MKYDIVAVGEILIDFTPYGTAEDGCARFGRNPGGAPANLLATASKYGAKTAFVGRVGADMFGEFLRKTLTDSGIDDTALITDSEHDTTLAFVSLDPSGDRRFAFYRRFGADRFLSPEDIPADLIWAARMFHFGTVSMTDEPSRAATLHALSLAREAGCLVSYDPNYRETLWVSEREAQEVIASVLPSVDVAKFSREEAAMIGAAGEVEDAAAALVARGPSLVFVTDGSGDIGYASASGARGRLPSAAVSVVDTTGAGDIFYGTCLYELLARGLVREGGTTRLPSDADIGAAVRRAIAAAGISVTRKGAIPSIPDYSEIPLA